MSKVDRRHREEPKVPLDRTRDGSNTAWRDEALCAWGHTELRAEPNSIRTTLLERLEKDNFVPPSQWHGAISLLRGNTDTPLARRFGAQHLSKEIDDFATTFFDCEPGERHERWRSLCESVRDEPALFDRVLRLQSGVEMTKKEFDDLPDNLRELGQTVRQLAVLPPVQAIHRRQAIAAAMTGEDRRRYAQLATQFRQHNALVKSVIEPISQVVRQSNRWDRLATNLAPSPRAIATAVCVSLFSSMCAFGAFPQWSALSVAITLGILGAFTARVLLGINSILDSLGAAVMVAFVLYLVALTLHHCFLHFLFIY